jgi:hypothetical protein
MSLVSFSKHVVTDAESVPALILRSLFVCSVARKTNRKNWLNKLYSVIEEVNSFVEPRKPPSNHILNTWNFHLRSATSLPS